MAEKVYNWTDDPMVSGVADCNTDVVNDCLMHLKYENTTDAIQNMYTTGQVETQTRGFTQLQQMRRSTFDLSKFTVVGSPTITDDGVASGFSSANYLGVKYLNLKNDFEIDFEFTTQSITTQQCIMSCFYINPPTYFSIIPLLLRIEANGTILLAVNFLQKIASVNGKWGAIGTSTLVVLPDTKYYGRVIYNGINYQLYISTDGNNFTKYIDLEYSTPLEDYNIFALGRYTGQNLYPFAGSIDLSHFSITVDGKEVFSGNKTGIDTIKPDNYMVVGSPVISDDGVVSGFSGANYLTVPTIPLSTSTSWEIIIPIIFSNTSTTQYIISKYSVEQSITIGLWETGNIFLWLAAGQNLSSTFKPRVDTKYFIKVSYKNGTAYIDVSTDGKNYTNYGSRALTV